MQELLTGNGQAKKIGGSVVHRFEQEQGARLGEYDELRHFPTWVIEQLLEDREANSYNVEAGGNEWLLFLVGEFAYFCRFDELVKAEVTFAGALPGVTYRETFTFNENEQIEGELSAEHDRIPGGSFTMSFRTDGPREDDARLREQLRKWSGEPPRPRQPLVAFA